MTDSSRWPALMRLLTLGVVLTIYLPRFLTEGLDNDGLVYASLARNMAVGVGSFWKPYLGRSESYWIPTERSPDNVFYGHPPALFFLESLLYRLLGDHWYVEKLFSALWFGLLLAGCVRAWRVLFPDEPARAFAWLPVLWVATAWQIRFAASNNLLNVPQAACCVWALVPMVRGLRGESRGAWVEAVLWTFAAFLCKGPFGLFLWGLPGLYWLVFERTAPAFERRSVQTVGLVLGTSALLGLLLLYPPAREFFNGYFQKQVLAVATGSRVERYSGTEGPLGRWYIVAALLLNVAPMGLATVLLAGVVRRARQVPGLKQTGLWLALAGLSATLPIALIDKQYAHYVVAGTPFFALAFAAWQVPFWEKAFAWRSLSSNAFRYAVVAVAVGCAVLTGLSFRFHVTGVPPAMTARMDEIKQHPAVPFRERVAVFNPEIIQTDYYLNLYLQRYRRIELTPFPEQTPYLLTEDQPDETARAEAQGYRRLGCLPVNRVCFWKK
jgi:hypothetical protein